MQRFFVLISTSSGKKLRIPISLISCSVFIKERDLTCLNSLLATTMFLLILYLDHSNRYLNIKIFLIV